MDAYSTGAELAVHFKKHGYRAVHVQSSPSVDEALLASFRPGDFAAGYTVDGDWEERIPVLKGYNPAFCVAGTETGVAAADRLSAALGLAGNDPASSTLRRNKYEMQEALKGAGLRHIRQTLCRTPEEILDWSRERQIAPLVIKPVDSAGSDGVFFCESEGEVRRACSQILHRVNRMGSRNEQVLVQEMLEGQQYFVNAVSVRGEHVIVEIWRDTKKRADGAGMICDVEELLPFHGEPQQEIVEYVRSALDCLGVREGASHTELMMTPGGPVLIETGARMQGTILHDAVIAATGDSHVTTTVEGYVHPERLLNTFRDGYPLRKSLFCVTLASNLEGTVVENNTLLLLGALPSFYAAFHTPNAGERIERTVDLFSNPGIIYLLHENRGQILADYQKIREWESRGELFVIADPAG